MRAASRGSTSLDDNFSQRPKPAAFGLPQDQLTLSFRVSARTIPLQPARIVSSSRLDANGSASHQGKVLMVSSLGQSGAERAALRPKHAMA
jgi:hypothetical protein